MKAIVTSYPFNDKLQLIEMQGRFAFLRVITKREHVIFSIIKLRLSLFIKEIKLRANL